MLLVYFHGVTPPASFKCPPLPTGISEVLKEVEPLPSVEDVYFINNGKRITSDTPVTEGVVHVCPRLVGGKGGFGSMLRAIGAQIEKTTNREACRDLSGRRLRDINEEQRLKSWIAKKAEREREAAERKKKKLEKLRAVPKHDFKDKKYEEERSKLTTDVSNAVEKGFQSASSKPGPSKSTNSSKTRKGFMLEEEELSSSCESDSNEDTKQSEAQSSLIYHSDSSDSEQSTSQQLRDVANKSETLTSLKRQADSSDSEESTTKRQHVSSDSSSSSSESTSQSCVSKTV